MPSYNHEAPGANAADMQDQALLPPNRGIGHTVDWAIPPLPPRGGGAADPPAQDVGRPSGAVSHPLGRPPTRGCFDPEPGSQCDRVLVPRLLGSADRGYNAVRCQRSPTDCRLEHILAQARYLPGYASAASPGGPILRHATADVRSAEQCTERDLTPAMRAVRSSGRFYLLRVSLMPLFDSFPKVWSRRSVDST